MLIKEVLSKPIPTSKKSEKKKLFYGSKKFHKKVSVVAELYDVSIEQVLTNITELFIEINMEEIGGLIDEKKNELDELFKN